MESLEADCFGGAREICAIKEHGVVSNLAFSGTGELCAYCVGDSLKLYNAASGALLNIVTIEAQALSFFQRNTLLHAHEKRIYYLSVHDNRHMRCFVGHAGEITDISVCAASDTFMASGPSETTIWDIRMDAPLKRIATVDCVASMSAYGGYALCDGSLTRIFDMRKDNGPVAVCAVQAGLYRRMWYTADAQRIILAGDTSFAILDDEGESQGLISKESGGDGDSAADSSTLFCGSGSFVFAHKMEDRRRLGSFNTMFPQNNIIRANPVLPLIACASKDTVKLIQLG